MTTFRDGRPICYAAGEITTLPGCAGCAFSAKVLLDKGGRCQTRYEIYHNNGPTAAAKFEQRQAAYVSPRGPLPRTLGKVLPFVVD